MLEANGQVTFDDRRVASIVSRVAGRIEQVRVSQWDNVRRGEPIVTLYSPDYMTAEAEYLQARQTTHLSGAARHSSDGAGGLDGGRGRAQAGTARDEPADIARSAPLSNGLDARANRRHGDRNKATRGAAVTPGDVFIRSARSTMSGSPPISMRTISRASTRARQLEAETTTYPDESSRASSRESARYRSHHAHPQIRCTVANPGPQAQATDARAGADRHAAGPGAGRAAARAGFRHQFYFAYMRRGA